MKNSCCSEMRLGTACLVAVVIASLMTTSCGDQPIAAPSPLYVLIDDSGQLTVEVLNQSDYQVAGKIRIVSVGATPPTGAVAAKAGGQVLVTFSGVYDAQQLRLQPNTVACMLATSRCDTIWSGWGSATAKTLDDTSIMVPGWDDVHLTAGKLGFFGGAQLGLQRQVALAPSMPGPVAVSGDGRNVYWLTFTPSDATAPPEQKLLRVDATSGNVLSEIRFGNRLPFGITVSPDGAVLVSLLYDKAPLKPAEAGANPVVGVLGSTVEVFSPDLSTSRSLRVQRGPTLLAAGRSSLLVAATTTQNPTVGLFDLKSGSALRAPEIPPGWTLNGLDVIKLAGSDEVGMLELNSAARDRFRLGVVDLATGAVKWHEYPGQILGNVAA